MTVNEVLEGLAHSADKELTISNKLACIGGAASAYGNIERAITEFKEMYDKFMYYQAKSEADKLAECALWLAENALSLAAWLHKWEGMVNDNIRG